MWVHRRPLCLCAVVLCLVAAAWALRSPEEWARLRDADIDRMLHEDDDDDERAEPPPAQFDPKDPLDAVQQSKKGKPAMIFATLAGMASKEETERTSGHWQDMLLNAHIQCQRYIIADDRAMFMLTDGSQSHEVVNFLVERPECVSVELDQQVYTRDRRPTPFAAKLKQKKRREKRPKGEL